MWRDHINDFVAYTVATAKHDKAGQAKAVANLKQYTVTFGNFLAGATGLPKLAVQNDLLGHVLELKGQLDDYAAGQLHEGRNRLPRGLQPHVHDRRPRRRRDREAEEPQVNTRHRRARHVHRVPGSTCAGATSCSLSLRATSTAVQQAWFWARGSVIMNVEPWPETRGSDCRWRPSPIPLVRPASGRRHYR